MKKSKESVKIAIATASFPYPPGEQFLETEIEYWGKISNHNNIILLPEKCHGERRAYPERIYVEKGCCSSKSKLKIMVWACRALVSSFFLKEISYLHKKHKLSLTAFYYALKATICLMRNYEGLKRSLKKHGSDFIIYTYWLDSFAYAACLLKNEGLVSRVISRAHSFDVYEERRPLKYMPLKRQFSRSFDLVLAISNNCKNYLCNIYDFPNDNIEVSRLGVSIRTKQSQPTPDGYLSVISVSFCTNVKRIDKLIDSLSILSMNYPDMMIKWYHIGDGPLFKNLQKEANNKLSCKNIQHKFLGHLSNIQVRDFMQNNSLDVFVNLSEYEGIPVSIMEAMASGIPVVATTVGGVSEIVNEKNGILLNDHPTTTEIFSALSKISYFKSKKIRQAAFNTVNEYYNAEKNYPMFLSRISELL